jgi:hypothetical protein
VVDRALSHRLQSWRAVRHTRRLSSATAYPHAFTREPPLAGSASWKTNNMSIWHPWTTEVRFTFFHCHLLLWLSESIKPKLYLSSLTHLLFLVHLLSSDLIKSLDNILLLLLLR